METLNATATLQTFVEERETTLEEVLDQLEEAGYPRHEAEAAFSGDVEEWKAWLLALLEEVIGLSEGEVRSLQEAMLKDAREWLERNRRPA